MQIIDLTKTIETGMQVYPGDPEVEVRVVHTYDKHTWELRELRLGSHTGTHVDACSHMHKNGKTLDELPLTKFFGKALVVELEQEFPENVGLFFNDEVGLEIVDKIVQARAPFAGGLINEQLERALLKEGIVTYTNLINLELIGKGVPFTFYGLPLKIKEGDSSPVRAIAILD